VNTKDEILEGRPSPVERLMEEIDYKAKETLGQSLYECQTVEQVEEIRQMLTKTYKQFEKTYPNGVHIGVKDISLCNGSAFNVNLTVTYDTVIDAVVPSPVAIKAYVL